MCYEHIIQWACGHRNKWEQVSCELGNRPLPGGCPTGKAVGQYLDCDTRRGGCPDCVKKRVEAEEARRRQGAEEAVFYRRQSVNTFRDRRLSLITNGFERLRLQAEKK